jgi:ADP-dependent NAD(P)H-hydrate dehydratase / NAD(P)H-hydrate epimerase
MIPLVSAEVMRECDGAAVTRWGVDTLVNAAGHAVANEVRRLLGPLYGRRIAVVAGPGLNGRDGLVAARVLRRRGAVVDVVMVAQQPPHLTGYDLVIDAAFGLGCSRPYSFPRVAAGCLVVAVDLPSGVDPDTGALWGHPVAATATVALGAVKFAHVQGPSAHLVGQLRCAAIGIEAPLDAAVMTDADLTTIAPRAVHDHKWSHAVSVFAGSPLMPGAAALLCAGALAGGASLLRLESRGSDSALFTSPAEVVHSLDGRVDRRCRAVAAGPGLGADADEWLRERLHNLRVPVVLDADALTPATLDVTSGVERVVTPHLGEFERLDGVVRDERRVEAARDFAVAHDCVTLLKGPTTVVASPRGGVRVVRSGTTALASAGSGDVLTGLVAAALARGLSPLDAAAWGAQLHGRASHLLGDGASASDLPAALRQVTGELARGHLVGAGGLEPSTSAV